MGIKISFEDYEKGGFMSTPKERIVEKIKEGPDLDRIWRNMETTEREQQLSLFKDQGIPHTPPNTSPMNNHLARTPLFAPIHRGKRVTHTGTIMYTQKDDFVVRYYGEQLDMADQDVLLYAYYLAAGTKPIDATEVHSSTEVLSAVLINRAEFLKGIGMKKSGQNYQWLEKSLFRLARANVDIQTKYYHDMYTFIHNPGLDKETGDYRFFVPLSTFMFFYNEQIGYVNRERRLLLENRVDLAKWIQTYAVSHAKDQDYKIKIVNLKERCGNTGRLRDFRVAVKEALQELVRVGEFQYAHLDERDIVSWRRVPK